MSSPIVHFYCDDNVLPLQQFKLDDLTKNHVEKEKFFNYL